jgi:exodeoxyribonuclease-3
MKYKLISWNIDSLNAALTSDSNRAKMTQKVLKDLQEYDADIIAIQEIKLKETGPTKKHFEHIEEYFPGYKVVYNTSKKPARTGYAGTMFLFKENIKPINIEYPTIQAPCTMDLEGRIITMELDDFYLTQVYTPNAGSNLDRLDDRNKWDHLYIEYMKALDKLKPVVACGDYNVAVEEIDIANPKANKNNAGFTDTERNNFRKLLNSGFTDSFRYIYPDKDSAYTWWSQIAKTSKVNNAGWRIDYFLTSDCLKDKIIKSEMIDSGDRQDHTPLYLEIEI